MRENVVGELYLDGIRVDTGGAIGSTRYINGLKELYLGGTPIGFDAKHVTVSNASFLCSFVTKMNLQKVRLQSWTKLLRHFTKFPLIQGTITNVFDLIPPYKCCQCSYVVKTKSGKLQTPRNNIERGGGGLNILYPLVSQDIREKCVIFVCLTHFCPGL